MTSFVDGPAASDAKTLARSVTATMHAPVDGFDGFWELLIPAFRTATALANQILAHYYATDMARVGKLGEVPKMKGFKRDANRAVYMRFRPLLTTGSACSIDQWVWKKYRGADCTGRTARWNALAGMASLSTFRFPVPMPIHNANWRVEERGDDVVILFQVAESFKENVDFTKLRVHNLNMKEIAVTLRNNDPWPLGWFRKIARGEIKRSQLDLILVEKNDSRPATIKFKTTVPMPIETRARSGSMEVVTGDSPKLKVIHNGKIWKWHADHWARRIETHRQWIQKFADNSKFEPRQERSVIHDRREMQCATFDRWTNERVKKLAAWVVGYADRRGVAELVYDDKDRSGFASFPWKSLSDRIAENCLQKGIAFSLRAHVAAA